MGIPHQRSDVLAFAREATVGTPPLTLREPARSGLTRAGHAPRPVERLLLAHDALALAARVLDVDPALSLREVDRALAEIDAAFASGDRGALRFLLAVLVGDRLHELRRALDARRARTG